MGVCVKELGECKEALTVQKGDKCSGCGGPLVIIGDEVGLEIYFHGDITNYPHVTWANGVVMSSIKTDNDVLSFITVGKWDGCNTHMIPLKHVKEIVIDTRPRPEHHAKIRHLRQLSATPAPRPP